jgi:hypothetical protein
VIRLPLRVHHRDGSVTDVSATQYSLGAWATYCAKQGIVMDPENPGILAVVQLRYMAWAELSRDDGPRGGKPVGFAAWDTGVDEVEKIDDGAADGAADPTRTAA